MVGDTIVIKIAQERVVSHDNFCIWCGNVSVIEMQNKN